MNTTDYDAHVELYNDQCIDMEREYQAMALLEEQLLNSMGL